MKSVPKPVKKKKVKRKKLTSIKTLMKQAVTAFNFHIRERDRKDLNGKCCTCGKPGNQAGHFVPATHSSVRFNTHNVHLQCSQCNCWGHGRLEEYSKFIIEKYGMEEFNWLLSQKHVVKKYSRGELEQIIRAYS